METKTETATGIEATQKSRVSKVVIIVLALAIVVAGGLLLMRTFGSSGESSSLAGQITPNQDAVEGTTVTEVSEDENGEPAFHETTVEDE